MKIHCPLCEQEIEVENKLQDGQHIICPYCEKKFTYYSNARECVAPEPLIIASGEEFEKFLCGKINDLGCATCEMTKASGDQGVDLVVTVGGRKLAVQCKLYSSPVGNDAVQQVIAGKLFYKCDAAMVVSNAKFTDSAHELANAAEVMLVDYHEITNVIMRMSNGLSGQESEDELLEKAISAGDSVAIESGLLKRFFAKPSLRLAFKAIDVILELTASDNKFQLSRGTYLLLGQFYNNLTVLVKCVPEKFLNPLIGKQGVDFIEIFVWRLAIYWRLCGIYYSVAGETGDGNFALDEADSINDDYESMTDREIHFKFPTERYGEETLIRDTYGVFMGDRDTIDKMITLVEEGKINDLDNDECNVDVRVWAEHPQY